MKGLVSLFGDIDKFVTGEGDRITSDVGRSVRSRLVTMLILDASSRDVRGSWILNCMKGKNANNKRTILGIDYII